MKLHKQNKNLIKHLIFNFTNFKSYLLTQRKKFQSIYFKNDIQYDTFSIFYEVLFSKLKKL